MLKLTGALLIMGGAGWWGWRAVSRLRRRVWLLEELRQGLACLEEELAFRLTPLPRLLERLGEEKTGAAPFFREVLRGLEEDPEGGVRASWRRAMVRCLDVLREEERQVLVEVGEILGQYDAAAQCQALARAAGRLERVRLQAEEESRRLGRVYAAVSLAAGAGLALVLI